MIRAWIGALLDRGRDSWITTPDLDAARRAAGQLTYTQLEAMDWKEHLAQKPAPATFRQRMDRFLDECRIQHRLRALPRVTTWTDLNPFLDGWITYVGDGSIIVHPQLQEIAAEQALEVTA